MKKKMEKTVLGSLLVALLTSDESSRLCLLTQEARESIEEEKNKIRQLWESASKQAEMRMQILEKNLERIAVVCNARMTAYLQIYLFRFYSPPIKQTNKY